jgi:hypothetical protein
LSRSTVTAAATPTTGSASIVTTLQAAVRSWSPVRSSSAGAPTRSATTVQPLSRAKAQSGNTANDEHSDFSVSGAFASSHTLPRALPSHPYGREAVIALAAEQEHDLQVAAGNQSTTSDASALWDALSETDLHMSGDWLRTFTHFVLFCKEAVMFFLACHLCGCSGCGLRLSMVLISSLQCCLVCVLHGSLSPADGRRSAGTSVPLSQSSEAWRALQRDIAQSQRQVRTFMWGGRHDTKNDELMG